MPLTYVQDYRHVYEWNYTTGSWYPPTSVLQTNRAWEHFRSPLVKTPNGPWRKPTNYERIVRSYGPNTRVLEFSWKPGSYPMRRVLVTNSYQHNSGLLFPSLPTASQNLENRAVNEALSSLKQQKIHLGVAFGERKETAEFVTDTIHDVRSLYRSVRKGDLKAVKNQLLGRQRKQRHHRSVLHEVLDAPAGLLLKNTYALKPLLADMHGAVEVLNEKDRADPTRYATKTKVNRSEPFLNLLPFAEDHANIRHYWLGKQKGYTLVKVRLDYYLENPFLHSLASAGITNPLEIAWELVPFSFVVDWVYPFGSYLSTLDATLGLKFRGGSITKATRDTVTVEVDKSQKPRSMTSASVVVNTHQQVFKCLGTGFKMKRVALSESPTGRLPSLKNPFSFPRLAVAIALLAKLTDRRG